MVNVETVNADKVGMASFVVCTTVALTFGGMLATDDVVLSTVELTSDGMLVTVGIVLSTVELTSDGMLVTAGIVLPTVELTFDEFVVIFDEVVDMELINVVVVVGHAVLLN